MTILHISDMHFDIAEPNEYLMKKWKNMIACIKENEYKIDWLVISGDSIYFIHMEENFSLAENFIKLLQKELHVPGKKTLLCAGNHDLVRMEQGGRDICEKTFSSFEETKNIYMQQYISFYEAVCNRPYIGKETVSVYEGDDATFVVADTLTFVANEDGESFFRNCSCLQQKLEEQKYPQKVRILVQHAEERYMCSKCEKKIRLPKGSLVLCGHKHLNRKLGVYPFGDTMEVVSGVSDGLVEECVIFNLYQIIPEKIEIKHLVGRGPEWSIVVE